MTYVMDSTAMIAYLVGEPGADVVETHLLDNTAVCVAHAINLCEVYYHTYRQSGEVAAETAIETLANIGIRANDDLDDGLWRQAGKIKGSHRLSIADALAIALTLKLGGEFITSDHHELDPLAAAGVCHIKFFR
jgi:predicted nucleic acid-binding protein